MNNVLCRMILKTFRKFWWIPLLVILAGYFLFPSSEKSSSSTTYSVSFRFRSRPAFSAEVNKSIEHFCDSSLCLKSWKNIKTQVHSTREDEYIFTDIQLLGDSIELRKSISDIDACIHEDSTISSLIFKKGNDIKRLLRNAKVLRNQLPARDSLNHFILEKEIFELQLTENDIKDHFLYIPANEQKIELIKTASGGSIYKRFAILSIVGLFLMVFVGELSRRRKSENDKS